MNLKIIILNIVVFIFKGEQCFILLELFKECILLVFFEDDKWCMICGQVLKYGIGFVQNGDIFLVSNLQVEFKLFGFLFLVIKDE